MMEMSERTGSRLMAIASRTMTLDEFLAQHELDPVLEYAQGVVTENPAPSLEHGILASLIGHQINIFAYPRKLALTVMEVRTTDRATGVSRVPDISVYVWDRIERDPAAQRHGSYVPPDIAIEIASPGQSRRKQVERCRQFVEQGVRIALMVDPRSRSIVEVRPDRAERRLRGDDVLDLGDVIPGFTLVVGELFAALRFE
jgi:Uma2 family endonuclease